MSDPTSDHRSPTAEDAAYAPDDSAETAFTESDNHALGDLELQPYNPIRIVAAQAMGLRHPNIGEEAMEQFKTTGVYPGALSDTLIVLYLCTLGTAAEVRRCGRKPDEAYEKAIAWGAERGIINMRSETFWQAYGKFIDIVSEVSASVTVPKLEGAAASPGNP